MQYKKKRGYGNIYTRIEFKFSKKVMIGLVDSPTKLFNPEYRKKRIKNYLENLINTNFKKLIPIFLMKTITNPKTKNGTIHVASFYFA